MAPEPIIQPLPGTADTEDTIVYSPAGGGRWLMAVRRAGRDGGPLPPPTPEGAATARYLTDRVTILDRTGRAGQVGPEVMDDLAWLRETDPDHPAVAMVRDAVTLLAAPHDPWQPPDDWAGGLPWYDPEHGDDGTTGWPGRDRHGGSPCG